jgi:hypothetical protein
VNQLGSKRRALGIVVAQRSGAGIAVGGNAHSVAQSAGPGQFDEGGGARRACLESRRQAAEPERGRAVGKNCGEKAPRLMGGANRCGLRVYGLAGWVEGSCLLGMKVFQNFVFPFPKAQKRN